MSDEKLGNIEWAYILYRLDSLEECMLTLGAHLNQLRDRVEDLVPGNKD